MSYERTIAEFVQDLVTTCSYSYCHQPIDPNPFWTCFNQKVGHLYDNGFVSGTIYSEDEKMNN